MNAGAFTARGFFDCAPTACITKAGGRQCVNRRDRDPVGTTEGTRRWRFSGSDRDGGAHNVRRNRITGASVFFAVAVFVGAPPMLSAALASSRDRTLLDVDMGGYPVGTCYSEGQLFGSLLDVFNGYGSTCVRSYRRRHELDLQPEASTSASTAHAALTTTTASFNQGDGYTFSVEYRTVRRLRTGVNDLPNPWEVGWVLWNYSGNDHFYDVILKPNGWEVNKEYLDSKGNQAQQFLATGTSPRFAVGGFYQVMMVQTVSRGVPTFVVKATARGGGLQTLAAVTDRGTSVSGPPYTSGKVGVYAEDSEVQFGSIGVTSPNERREGRRVGRPSHERVRSEA
jgi:hypothetical protein